MRYILLFIGLLFFYAGTAQDTTDCYFDQQLALTNKKSAAYEGKMVNTWCDYYLYGMTKADYAEIVDKGLPIYRNVMAQ